MQNQFMNLFSQGLVKESILECGGKIIPITPEWDHNLCISLMNPSIFNDNGIIKACVRGVNYTLHHSEKGLFSHWAGPLQYIHPENDVRLATENFLAIFDDDLNLTSFKHIDMLKLHEPIWNFHGLEDGRLFRWNNRLYICGVRRDTTTDGQGRMEMSEIEETDDRVIEVSRNRIPAPGDDTAYCEKNWMPILDQPYSFIAWSNPTKLIDWNPEDNTITCFEDDMKASNRNYIRGNSHVLRYKHIYFAIGHDMNIWKPYAGEKDATYSSYVMIWDENFNLLMISEPFKFLNSKIEFCCGMCMDNKGKLLISFSDEDNAAYILKLDIDWFLNKVINYGV